METKITLQENQTIEVNGAVLTFKTVEQIKSFQENENECLKSFKENIADVICFIAKEAIDYQGIDKEAREKYLMFLSADLSYCRDSLNELQSPKQQTNQL